MKKEHFVVITFLLFIFAGMLHYLAGNVFIKVSQNPYTIIKDLDYIKKIPLTGLELIIRTIAILFTLGLSFSIVKYNYFTKAIVMAVLIVISQLYSIQQIMTRGSLTTMQWTLPIAYAGALSLIFIIVFVFQGIVLSVHNKLIDHPKQKLSENKEGNSSILNP